MLVCHPHMSKEMDLADHMDSNNGMDIDTHRQYPDRLSTLYYIHTQEQYSIYIGKQTIIWTGLYVVQYVSVNLASTYTESGRAGQDKEAVWIRCVHV